MNQKKVGKFTVTADLIDTRPEVLDEVIERLDAKLLGINPMLGRPVFEYVLECDKFRELQKGEAIPDYHVHIK